MPYVYIIKTQQHDTLVQRLVKDLQAAGIQTQLSDDDFENVPQKRSVEVPEALQTARGIIYFHSASDAVVESVLLASRRGIPVCGVLEASYYDESKFVALERAGIPFVRLDDPNYVHSLQRLVEMFSNLDDDVAQKSTASSAQQKRSDLPPIEQQAFVQSSSPTTHASLPSHIYIAYSGDAFQYRFIERLLQGLREQGYSPWIDFENYSATTDWRRIALPFIQAASLMIVVVTPQSMQSTSVAWEAVQAQQTDIPIIPVVAQSATLRGVVANYAPVTLTTEVSRADFTPLYERLARLQIQIQMVTLRGARNDRVTAEDQLEFKHYVFALADLVTSPDTEPPITIGIFGSWGAGKSFLLDHIKRKIKDSPPYGEPHSPPPLPTGRSLWLSLRRRLFRYRTLRSHNFAIWRRPFVKLSIVLFKPLSYFAEGITSVSKWLVNRIKTMWDSLARFAFDLEETREKSPPTVKVEIVEFNAWEYSATDIVWPGLVRKIMTLLENEVSIPVRLRTRLTRNIKQQTRYLQLWLLLAISALSAVVIANMWTSNAIGQGLTVLGLIGLAGSLIKIVTDLLANPLGKWITTLFEKTDYGKQIGYMEEIRHDLELLERGLRRRNKRVLILVDDLDRCEPEKAVEMLQAVKLLLNFDSFIVVLGIDARIITRAVEQHYQNLLGPAGASGYEYLDKIIQIPFRIPEPTYLEIEGFIEQQMLSEAERRELIAQTLKKEEEAIDNALANEAFEQQSPTQPNVNIELAVVSDDMPRDVISGEVNQAASTMAEESGLAPHSEIIMQTRALPFTPEEREIFKALSMLLKPNPRHIKRLINVYRLIKALSEYKNEPFIRDNRLKTIHWVALCGQWPYTVYAMLQLHNELLEDEFEAQQSGEMKELFPPVDNVLIYLYEMVAKQLDENICARLDYDPDQFRWLVAQCPLTWAELSKLRLYTVNFNPAVETEIRSRFKIAENQESTRPVWLEWQ